MMVHKQCTRLFTGTMAAGVALMGLLACLVLTGCNSTVSESSAAASSESTSTAAPVELNVSAVVALEGVLEETAADFESANNCKLVFNTASAGVLQTQVEGGSETDVLLVTPKEIKALTQEGLVSGESTATFAINTLVIMVAAGNPKGIDDPSDLLQCNLLTTGDPETTAQGPKAKEWLSNIGMWESLQGKFVFAKDAAQINEYVSSGEVDAAICFASNAANKSNLEVAYTVPNDEYTAPKHTAGIVTGSANIALAEKYIAYLQSDEFRSALTAAGFKAPSN